MAFAHLFPYTNRSLSLESSLTPLAQRMLPYRLAQIALSNMKTGDLFSLYGDELTVISSDSDAVVFDNGISISADQLDDSSWITLLGQYLSTLAPAYTDPLVQILERDPAVFRLRTGFGWVINDALCKMTGNVQYPNGSTARHQDPLGYITKDPLQTRFASPLDADVTPASSILTAGQMSLF